MSGSASRNSLADIFAASGELPPHPLLERIQRNPVGMNRFEDSMTVPTPGIDPLAGFVGGVPVTQGQAAALPVDPVSGRLNESGLMMANSLMGASSGVVPKSALGIRAFHGSPHEFDQFTTAKIGTGEGAQAYGHGLYFAEAEDVARGYRDNLSAGAKPGDYGWIVNGVRDSALPKEQQDVLRQYLATRDAKVLKGTPLENAMIDAAPAGHMYEVNINAPPEHFLDYDKPISQQSPFVRERLADVMRVHKFPLKDHAGGDTTGSQLYEHLTQRFGGNHAEATKELLGEGIPGIRYADAGSRRWPQQYETDLKEARDLVSGLEAKLAAAEPLAAGGDNAALLEVMNAKSQLETFRPRLQQLEANPVKASYNTVVFDDATIEILRKYGLAGLMAGGAGAAAAGSGEGDPPL